MTGFNDLKSPLTFGRYKGKTPEQVLMLNPEYLVWAHTNVSFFKMSPEDLKKSKVIAETRLYEKRKRNPYKGRYYTDIVGDLDDAWDDYTDWTQSY